MRPVPRLHLISDSSLCPLDRFPALAREVADAGAGAVHLRDKARAAGALLEAALDLQTALGTSALMFVNDRVDVALLCDAAGVQLGEASLPVSVVKTLLPEQALVGRSVHDVAGAMRAADEGADFVIAGHVYPTASKQGEAGRGSAFIESIAAAVAIPIIAIGGITPERVAEMMRAGAHGVAVVSGILKANDPAEAARAYAEAIERAG